MARWTASGDRSETEASLQQAALDLLDRNGVLSGLNLREVADEAGVNRGLVYHYFGSRRDLLRAALLSGSEQRLAEHRDAMELRLRERHRGFFATMTKQRAALKLMALLALDEDPDLCVIRDPGRPREVFERDIENGDLPVDIDIEALHIATVSLVYGYLIFRDQFSNDLDLDVDQLDDRLAAVADLLLAGLKPAVPQAETKPLSSSQGSLNLP